jgi:hypothetical protein
MRYTRRVPQQDVLRAKFVDPGEDRLHLDPVLEETIIGDLRDSAGRGELEPVRQRFQDFVEGRAPLTAIELYYQLERCTPLVYFHLLLRKSARNRNHNGLQQSYGDHNRLMLLAADKLVAGDLDWYTGRVALNESIGAQELQGMLDTFAGLGLEAQELAMLWLSAALHDFGKLVGRGYGLDSEDGVAIAAPLLAAVAPEELVPAMSAMIRCHDLIEDVLSGAAPLALIAREIGALPPDQQRLGWQGLGIITLTGAASLGEGRLNKLRMRLFDACARLGDSPPSADAGERFARLVTVGTELPPLDAALPQIPVPAGVPESFLSDVVLQGWPDVQEALASDGISDSERVQTLSSLVEAVATIWQDEYSDCEHVVLDGGVPDALAPSASGTMRLAPLDSTELLNGARAVLVGVPAG